MFKRLLALSLIGIGSVGAAHATSLLPGGTVGANVIPVPPGLIDEVGFGFGTLGTGTFLTNLTIYVFQDPANPYCAGCLEFAFALDNIGTTGSFTTLTVGSFAGYQTNVGQTHFNGGQNPTSITRSADGALITFNLPGLTPGQISEWLVVETDATTFVNSGTITTGDGVATLSGFDPTPVPEPSTLLLLGSGLAGLAGVARRKLTI